MTQADLQFDAAEGLKRKRRGMTLAEIGRKENIELIRKAAIGLAMKNGTVCMDDLWAEMPRTCAMLKNAAGGIFTTSDFEYAGYMTNSKRPEAHYRAIRVWRLRVQ